ncbi:MAG: hypothetical protein QNK37_06550 [Acidobacteriota bacterium]|nr:hypothetical protein [Acidobacteriota bacterium]
MLDPLRQRLLLYRFAVVQLDPHLILEPEDWQLNRLQYLPGPYERHYWDQVLGRCESFRTLSNDPVISPSLSVLAKVRAERPDRPLIFCRTAFEPTVSRHSTHHLPRPADPVTGMLQSGDPWLPLYRVALREQAPLPHIKAYHPSRPHPLARIHRAFQQYDPHALLTLREDGQSQAQSHLFYRPVGPFLLPGELMRLRHLHDHAFRKQLSDLRGRYYIFANKKEPLDWFRRDCKRLLPAHVFCWDYPEGPDPRDPLTHFILVPDAAIRFAVLNPKIHGFSLDGDGHRDLYRLVRWPAVGDPDWFSDGQAEARAEYRVRGEVLTFHRNGRGWFCQRSPEAARDKSVEFQQRLNALKLLTAPKQPKPKLWRRGIPTGKHHSEK